MLLIVPPFNRNALLDELERMTPDAIRFEDASLMFGTVRQLGLQLWTNVEETPHEERMKTAVQLLFQLSYFQLMIELFHQRSVESPVCELCERLTEINLQLLALMIDDPMARMNCYRDQKQRVHAFARGDILPNLLAGII